MSWFDVRTELETLTHGVFQEPASYAHEDGTGARDVVGVLVQAVDTKAIDGEWGHETTDDEYEIRKASATPPLTQADFRNQGMLTLASGQVFVVIYVRQTDTLIYLGLAPVEA